MFQTLLKERAGFSNYEVALIHYLLKTFGSELSKFLVMLILFHNDLPLYFFSIVLLCTLRMTSGGFHCSTYWRCFTVTLSYMILVMFLLPNLWIGKTMQIILLLACIITNFILAPITSIRHVPLSNKAKKIYKYISTGILSIYSLLLLIIPQNTFFISGFWIIILHAVQLILADVQHKFLQK